MLTHCSCCLLQRLSVAGPSLGSELAGTLPCGLQPGPTAAVAVVRKPRPRVNICSPDTRPSHCRVRLARVGYGGMYRGRGQMSGTSSDGNRA